MTSHASATTTRFGEPADPDDAGRSFSRAGVMGDHLIVLHSAVRACPGYSRHDAPSIGLDGSSIARDTEHGRAMTAQLTRRHGTLEEAIAAAVFALGAAGLSRASAVRRAPPARTTSTAGSTWRRATSWADGERRSIARADARADVPGPGGCRRPRRGWRVRGAPRRVRGSARSRGHAPTRRGRLPRVAGAAAA